MTGMKQLIIMSLVLLSGCAAGARTVSLEYVTPGSCHFDYGQRVQVRNLDGKSSILLSRCETTDQVLSGRF